MAKKKQFIEERIFSIYSDYPILVNDEVVWHSVEKPLHFHYYLEIGLCLSGSGVFGSSTGEYEVEKDDLVIVAPNILHTTRANSKREETKWASLYIGLDDLLKLFPVGDMRNRLHRVQESFRDIYFVDCIENPEIKWIMSEILRLDKEKQKSYKMQIMGLLYTMIFKIYDIFFLEFQEEMSAGQVPIMPAIDYIYDHFAETIKVKTLAEACHFSEGYFRKVFKEMKGIGPMDYVHSIRIREACEMLLNTNIAVHLIGEKCGYPSVTTFERNFRQKTGMLPSEYRESQRNPRKKDKKIHNIKRVYVDET